VVLNDLENTSIDDADPLIVLLKVTTQVDSLKGAFPRQSWKTEGYCAWASGPSVLPSAFGLQPTHLSSYY